MHIKTGMQIILSKNQDFDLECEICDPVMSFLIIYSFHFDEVEGESSPISPDVC